MLVKYLKLKVNVVVFYCTKYLVVLYKMLTDLLSTFCKIYNLFIKLGFSFVF